MSRRLPSASEGTIALPLSFLGEIAASNSTQEIIETLARWLPRIVACDRASISLVKDDAYLTTVAFAGDGAIPAQWPLPIADTACGWSHRNRAVRIIPDIALPEHGEADLRMLADRGLRCVVNVPLLTGGRCLGTLNLAHRQADFYAAEDAQVLESIALWVAPQIELRGRAEKVASSIKQKAAFVAKLSHEIRMPLNSVLGMGQLLKNTPLDQTQVAYVEAILSSGRSLRMLVEDLQDVAQLEAGLLVLAMDSFKPADLIGQTVDNFASEATKKGLTVWSKLSEDCTDSYVGDVDRVRRVLFNLVDNAVRYTHAGEIKISVAPAETGGLRFTVADSGPGITHEEQASIFRLFRRAEVANVDQEEDSGLGLAMAGRLVSMMDGRIALESEPGHGATFWFELPLGAAQGRETAQHSNAGSMPSRNQASHSPPAQIAAQPADMPPAVLLAEDNALNQELMICALEPLGVEVVTAMNGAEALKLLSARPFDLVLMDIQMPVMTGDEAIRQIRGSQHDYADVPIIALTANAMQGAREEYLNAGATAYLSKPVNIQELIHKVLNYARPQGRQTAAS